MIRSRRRSVVFILAVALSQWAHATSASADDPCRDANEHAAELAAKLTRSLPPASSPGAFSVERTDDDNGLATAFDVAYVVGARAVLQARIRRDPGERMTGWAGYLTLDVRPQGNSLVLTYNSGGSHCCLCSNRIVRVDQAFSAMSDAETGRSSASSTPPARAAAAPGACELSRHREVSSLAELLSTSLDTSLGGSGSVGRFEVVPVDSAPEAVREAEFFRGGKLAARGAILSRDESYAGGAYDLVARGSELAVTWQASGASCSSRCLFAISPSPAGFVARSQVQQSVPCEIRNDARRMDDTSGADSATQSPASSRTLTVPGWIDDWQLHVKPLGLQGDYLSAPVMRILPSERLSSFVWERLLRKTQSAVSSLRRQIFAIASEDAGEPDKGPASLHIEAHSWGGVLAFFALRELQDDPEFLRIVFGGDDQHRSENRKLWIHLDTMGSPIGCLESSDRDDQAGIAAIGATFVRSLPTLAFERAGLIRPQPVALDPKLVDWRNYVIDGDPIACPVASLGPSRAIELPIANPQAGLVERHGAYWEDAANLRRILGEGRIALLPLSGQQEAPRRLAGGEAYSWGGPGWGLTMQLPPGSDPGEYGRGASLDAGSSFLLLQRDECQSGPAQRRRIGAYSFDVAREVDGIRYLVRLPSGRCHAFYARSAEAQRRLEQALASYSQIAGTDSGHVPD